MSKWLTGGALVLVGLLVGVVLLGPLGEGGDEISLPSTITTAGTASVRSTPDEAVLRLGIRAEGKTSEDAFAEKGAKTDDVVASLKEHGVAEEDIQTVDLRLFNRTENRDTPQEHKVWIADTDLEVILREMDKAGEVAGAAVGAGATSVRGIEFRLGNTAKAKDQALREAIEGARSKAEAMAEASGTEVGEVRLIDETNSQVQPYQAQAEQALFAAGASGDLATDAYKVEPGEVTTQVTVTVVWELGD